MDKKTSASVMRFFWQLVTLLGAGMMLLVGLLSYRSDVACAAQSLSDATRYVKQQYSSYDRFNDTSVTKSLMRAIENAQQINRNIQYMLEMNGDAISPEALQQYAYDQRLTGIILMNEHGTVQREYSADALDYEALRAYVTKETVLETAHAPAKTYATRIRLRDGSYVDLAAHGRTDEPGVIVVYYHTSAEYATNYNLTIQHLLEGYDPGTAETLVVTTGDSIIAANREGLVNRNVNDIPVLRSIRDNAKGGQMTRVRSGAGDGEWVYCMLERGRDYYVYAYMPLSSALETTPKNLIFTLICYAMVLVLVIMIRWKLKQGYQEEQLRREQKHQRELREAAVKAESANRAKTEFLQRMSHDIRTPINGIRGMVEIGDHYSTDLAKQAECRRKIWDASTLLLELVNEVLDMGKLESGEVVLESRPFNVIALQSTIRFTLERAAAERGITITDDTDVPHPHLIGSPLHVKRLLMNILSNAVKYNKDNGSIALTCRELRSDDTTAWIEFTCADTGIGMSEEFQKHLYEPFTQEHSDARSTYNGTGLGMAITKSLVEKMGGEIECRSKLGEGTTYRITIPFAIDTSADPADGEETALLPDASPNGMKVLLAEDNDLNMEIAVFVLENAGVTVTQARNGKEALDLFAASAPGTFDAILMDIMMPVMDGYQATRAIRKLDRPDAGNIPILAMTANAFTEDRRRAYEAGMNEHLTKPLEPNVVLATLAKYK